MRSISTRPAARGAGEAGSAVVGYTLVTILVIIVFATLAQLMFAGYTRIVMTDTAGEAARMAARFDATEDAARTLVERVNAEVLPAIAISDVDLKRASDQGLDVVEVVIRCEYPLIGMWGIGGMMEVSGRALAENVSYRP